VLCSQEGPGCAPRLRPCPISPHAPSPLAHARSMPHSPARPMSLHAPFPLPHVTPCPIAPLPFPCPRRPCRISCSFSPCPISAVLPWFCASIAEVEPLRFTFALGIGASAGTQRVRQVPRVTSSDLLLIVSVAWPSSSFRSRTSRRLSTADAPTSGSSGLFNHHLAIGARCN